MGQYNRKAFISVELCTYLVFFLIIGTSFIKHVSELYTKKSLILKLPKWEKSNYEYRTKN